MKDEEMAKEYAEEYVMREDVITENDRVPFDNGYGFQTVSFEDEVKKGCKDGFLAGLKAGRPQWHDLREDPNDLPKSNRIVSDQKGNNVIYIDTLNKWFYRHLTYRANVIAWCEKPIFDKE